MHLQDHTAGGQNTVSRHGFTDIESEWSVGGVSRLFASLSSDDLWQLSSFRTVIITWQDQRGGVRVASKKVKSSSDLQIPAPEVRFFFFLW